VFFGHGFFSSFPALSPRRRPICSALIFFFLPTRFGSSDFLLCLRELRASTSRSWVCDSLLLPVPWISCCRSSLHRGEPPALRDSRASCTHFLFSSAGSHDSLPRFGFISGLSSLCVMILQRLANNLRSKCFSSS
jgi:hypothetical protein